MPHDEIIALRLGSKTLKMDKGVVITPKRLMRREPDGVHLQGTLMQVPYNKLTEDLKLDVRSLYPVSVPVDYFDSIPIYFVTEGDD